jgi:hypothetical protein
MERVNEDTVSIDKPGSAILLVPTSRRSEKGYRLGIGNTADTD